MLTDGRTDGQKIGRLYRTLLQAGAIKMTVHNVEKVTKNNQTITSKSYAHLHTMKKTYSKLYKTARGVALTRHPG